MSSLVRTVSYAARTGESITQYGLNNILRDVEKLGGTMGLHPVVQINPDRPNAKVGKIKKITFTGAL